MTQSPQTQLDRWRIIIPNRSVSEILVIEEATGLRLPEVNIPKNQRVAWHLNHKIKGNWNLGVISIVPVETSASSNGDVLVDYHVAELVPTNTLVPRGMRWASTSSLAQDRLPDVQDRTALCAFLNSVSSSENKAAAFGHPGWFGELAEWVRDVIAPFSLDWDGGFEQFQASATFSLIRFATKPQPVWFKAVGDPNTREFRVTQELARCCPAFVPRLLAVRPEWNAWLAEECDGKTLDEIVEIEQWRNASRTLAELQIASAPAAADLRRAGAHDLRRILTPASINHFFVAAEKLVPEYSDTSGLEILQDDLPEMKTRLLNLLAQAERSTIPDALGHLDLNAGNAVVSYERCIFLDWAEAYIGPPFLTLEYLLQSFRRAFGRNSPEEHSVVAAYLTTWGVSASRSAVCEAWAIAPALAVFAYAHRCLISAEPYGLSVPRFTQYLRSLLRRLKRELVNCKESRAGAQP
jgi:hypothetical protein